MKNLIKIREFSQVNSKIIAKLLNITVHTYRAFEQGKMTPPPEIIRMIAMMYRIDDLVLFDSAYFDQNVINNLIKISELSQDEKYNYLASGILGEEKPNYHNIKKVKDQIREFITKSE